jgi:alpha-beta hydrolase superfamily lysophospholipase
MGEHQQGIFLGKGKVELYYQSWLPTSSPDAILVIIHGLGGHSGLFSHIVDHLLPQNYGIYAYDLRGHGRSAGQRGHINRWDEFRSDLENFLNLVKSQHPDCPCFLWGHSLGGIIVLDYAIRYPQNIQGIIVVAAPLGQVGVSPIKVIIGKTLSKIWPNFTLDTGIELEAGTRDQQVLADYLTDPLRHTQATARLATEFFGAVDWVQSHIYELQVPLLMLHGGADRISLPEGVRLFFTKVLFNDKQLIEYPEAYHELHNELNYQEIVNDLSIWLEKHLFSTND